jgi:hypothetical protein
MRDWRVVSAVAFEAVPVFGEHRRETIMARGRFSEMDGLDMVAGLGSGHQRACSKLHSGGYFLALDRDRLLDSLQQDGLGEEEPL